MKYFFRQLFIILSCMLILNLGACDFFQSGLGSQMQKKLNDEAGRVSLSSKTWYYPGAADTDMSQLKAELALHISQKAAVAIPDDPLLPNGLTGAFKIIYNNIAGKQSTEEVSFKGGHFNNNYSVFYLDTSPVLYMMKPEKNPSGKGLLELTISGFVNDEDGQQKGRPLQPFTETIDFLPLFSGSKAYFSSSNPNMGRSIEIPLNAPVTFTPQADFIITGGNYPSDLLNADFDLSLSADGCTILLKPKKEFYNREFDFFVDIKGFIPPQSSLSAVFNVHVFVTNSLIVLDGTKDEIWNDPAVKYAADPSDDSISDIYPQPGNEITGLYVLSDSRNLYVALEFASLANMWELDRIGLLIDKVGSTAGDTTESLEAIASIPKLASKMTLINGTAYIYFVHLPGASAGRGNSMLRLRQFTVENDTVGAPAKVRASQYNWVNPNGPGFLEYRFALNDLGLETGDKIRILGVLANHWDSDFSIHSSDIVPGGPARPSSRDVVYDFSTALEYTLGVGPNYTQPQPEDFISAPAPSYISVSESGTNGVRLNWRPVFSAESYRIYRSSSPGGAYSRIDDVDWPVSGGIDWEVTPGSDYYYKVAAVNGKGESALSASVQVSVPVSGVINKVDMSTGLLDIAFHDPRSTVFTGDTKVAGNENGGNFTIERMYATSDDDNLYVALDFGSVPPCGYARSRIIVLVDNPDVSGSSIILPPIQKPAYETTINTASGLGNINQFIFKQLTATTDGGNAPLMASTPAGVESNNWAWGEKNGDLAKIEWRWTRCFDDWQYYPINASDGLSRSFLLDNAYRVIKFKIPKTNIDISAAGQKVRVFAAFSEGFDNDRSIFVRGFIPRAAAPTAVDNGDSMVINMAQALEYTF